MTTSTGQTIEASEPDKLIVATQGRGVYQYVFKNPAKSSSGA